MLLFLSLLYILGLLGEGMYELINMDHCLRVSDNRLIYDCLERGNTPVPIFVVDPFWYEELDEWGLYRVGPKRSKFIWDCVSELRVRLAEAGSELVLRRGLLEAVIPKELRALGGPTKAVYSYIPSVATYEVSKEKLLLKAIRDYSVYRYVNELTALELGVVYYPTCAGYARQAELPKEPVVVPGILPAHPLIGGTVRIKQSMGKERFKHYISAGEGAAKSSLESFLSGSTDGESGLDSYLSVGCLSRGSTYISMLEANKPQSAKGLVWDSYYASVCNVVGSLTFTARGPGPAHKPERARKVDTWSFLVSGDCGSSLVDQAVSKLLTQGYITNKERLLVADYLVHKLKCSHIVGARYFEEHLVGYTPWSNYISWQWVSGNLTPRPVLASVR